MVSLVLSSLCVLKPQPGLPCALSPLTLCTPGHCQWVLEVGECVV